MENKYDGFTESGYTARKKKMDTTGSIRKKGLKEKGKVRRDSKSQGSEHSQHLREGIEMDLDIEDLYFGDEDTTIHTKNVRLDGDVSEWV
jgi:hypothetical protein